MQVKLFEIRDRMTFIPAMSIRTTSRDEAERFLMSSAGYGITEEDHGSYIFLIRISDGELQAKIDAHSWNHSRTMTTAHKFIQQHWEVLESGDVIDVEFILGEKPQSKLSERFTR